MKKSLSKYKENIEYLSKTVISFFLKIVELEKDENDIPLKSAVSVVFVQSFFVFFIVTSFCFYIAYLYGFLLFSTALNVVYFLFFGTLGLSLALLKVKDYLGKVLFYKTEKESIHRIYSVVSTDEESLNNRKGVERKMILEKTKYAIDNHMSALLIADKCGAVGIKNYSEEGQKILFTLLLKDTSDL